jgi:hypothetical protein
MKYFLSLIALILLSTSYELASNDISDHSFEGKWCGKWDQIYEFCLTIDSINQDSKAKYQWKEFVNGKFKKSNKEIKRINRNTIKAENILLILNESNLEQAKAIGIFKVQTRTSLITRSNNIN